MNARVWTFPATVVGVARLGVAAWATWYAVSVDTPEARALAAVLLALSRLADLLDGYLARRWKHVSRFGSVLDLVADLATHTMVWWLSGLTWAWLFVVVEWTAGVGILRSALGGARSWKSDLSQSGPRWVRIYFAKNQRNLLSGYANVCHFLWPVSLFTTYATVVTHAALVPGVLLYEVVTLYLIGGNWGGERGKAGRREG